MVPDECHAQTDELPLPTTKRFRLVSEEMRQPQQCRHGIYSPSPLPCREPNGPGRKGQVLRHRHVRVHGLRLERPSYIVLLPGHFVDNSRPNTQCPPIYGYLSVSPHRLDHIPGSAAITPQDDQEFTLSNCEIEVTDRLTLADGTEVHMFQLDA
jgi:hypothetical protein